MSRFPKGSHPALTEELIEKLAATIRRGVYIETASALCGISKQSLYRWLRQAHGEDVTDLTVLLSDAVEKALAEAEDRDLAVIDAAAQGGTWQAAAWRLERKHPERWGRQAKVQLEHSGPGGQPIQVEDRRANLRLLLDDPGAVSALELIEEKLNAREPHAG